VTAAADSAFVSGVRLGAIVDLVVMIVAVGAVARYIPGTRPHPAVEVAVADATI
jgi:hypothetical protein